MSRLFFSAREKILNNFKSKISPTKNSDKILTPEPAVFAKFKPAKERTYKSLSKFYGDFRKKL